jgi:enoyl-CoA hydratase
MSDAVLRERQGHIEILTINRPEARNAINGAVSKAFTEAFDELERDDECNVVIVTGSGDKAFCAGMDLKAFAAGEAGDIMGARGGFGGIAQRDFPKPLIAAVNGSALAGGCEIMLSCDLAVAVEGAKFGIPEVKRGLMAGAGGLIRLPKRIPPAIALELALTGDPIDAQRALAIGLVNRVVPAGELDAFVDQWAATLAAGPPLALSMTKTLLQGSAHSSMEEAVENEARCQSVNFASEDTNEALAAFTEKREPTYIGR